MPDVDPSSQSTSTSLTIALVGNPNTGKSSLFNALCGMNARVGNFPGVTVEKKVGSYRDKFGEVRVIDLPGTYSLSARSADELVSVDVLLSRQPDAPKLDGVVVIVDASNIERNLYLFTQVHDLGLPVLLVLNMWDRVAESGLSIDLEQLRKRLGVPILTTSAHRRVGIDDVRSAIRSMVQSKAPKPISVYPDAFIEERVKLQKWLADRSKELPPDFLVERLILDIQGASQQHFENLGVKDLEQELAQVRERLSKAGCRVPTCETKLRYNWIRQQLTNVVQREEVTKLTTSDRIDRVLTHRFWGLFLFVLVMFAVFQSIYSGDAFVGRLAGIEDAGLIESGIGWLQSSASLAVESILDHGALRSLLVDGVIAGVGGVLVFLPQIAMLFFFIAILEDCGYMARAAFLMDKLMTRLGLSGKSFLPLMSSFGCAVPGIMGTRVIENRRDRMVTILVAPLMSCSARFPVYLLMVSAFVPSVSILGGWLSLQAVTLFSMQFLGAVVAIPVAWLLKKYFFPGQTPPFVMELPSYKWPSWRVVLQRVVERVQAFLFRAGTLILATSILVWAAGYFPADRSNLTQMQKAYEALEAQPNADAIAITEARQAINRESGRLMEESFLGMAGKTIEPIVKPLGWDWRIGVGVMASFPAREVIIATLGTIYSLGSEVDETDDNLRSTLQAAQWPDGNPVFTLPVAFSIMVFFALCAQCAATLMVIRRETNSWRWPIFTFVYMTSLAYAGAWIVYQIGSRIS